MPGRSGCQMRVHLLCLEQTNYSRYLLVHQFCALVGSVLCESFRRNFSRNMWSDYGIKQHISILEEESHWRAVEISIHHAIWETVRIIAAPIKYVLWETWQPFSGGGHNIPPVPIIFGLAWRIFEHMAMQLLLSLEDQRHPEKQPLKI